MMAVERLEVEVSWRGSVLPIEHDSVHFHVMGIEDVQGFLEMLDGGIIEAHEAC